MSLGKYFLLHIKYIYQNNIRLLSSTGGTEQNSLLCTNSQHKLTLKSLELIFVACRYLLLPLINLNHYIKIRTTFLMFHL